MMEIRPEGKRVFSIGELNQHVRELFQTHLPVIWVEGEISNLSQPASGHCYLTLKDQHAQVNCAMFRNRRYNLQFAPVNGMQVIVRCKADLYSAQGKFQLIIEEMEEAGAGALQRQFERLKNRLQIEGLFDNDSKKSMPRSIAQIGIITSPTGAAVKDILSVLKRRFPSIAISIYPSLVQGDQAAASIIDAIQIANSDNRCDVLIISRGGGSLEDLWPFNEEEVARAVYKSQLPIISAVGHEVDFTILDFVSDLRAATPSAAAEILSPNIDEITAKYAKASRSLYEAMIRKIRTLEQKADFLNQRLRHPHQQLKEQAHTLEIMRKRLSKAIVSDLVQQQVHLAALKDRHFRQHPSKLLSTNVINLTRTVRLLSRHTISRLQEARQKYNRTAHLLNTVSPLQTLSRGYSIMRDVNGSIVRSIGDINDGDRLKAHVCDGEIMLEVTDTSGNLLRPDQE